MARVVSDKPVGAFQRICPACHYVLEFSPADIREGQDEDEPESYRYVRCPRTECRKRIDLPKTTAVYDDT